MLFWCDRPTPRPTPSPTMIAIKTSTRIVNLLHPPRFVNCGLFNRPKNLRFCGCWVSSQDSYLGGGASKLCRGGWSLHLLLCDRFAVENSFGFDTLGGAWLSSSAMMERRVLLPLAKSLVAVPRLMLQMRPAHGAGNGGNGAGNMMFGFN